MALILEQFESRRPEHAIMRRLIDRPAITIGRALDNDVVLDDPFVDGHHACLVTEPDGALVLTDLGSVNLLELVGTGRVTRVALVPGVVVRLGRCSFRVRDSAEDVADAVPLPGAAVLMHSKLEDRRWSLALVLTVLATTAWSTWNASTTRDGAVETLLIALLAIIMLSAWAGIWALVGRLVTRRPAFAIHVAIGGLAWLGIGAADWLRGWAEFLWPTVWSLFGWVELGLVVVVLIFAIVAHLEYATHLPGRRRWSGVMWATLGVFMLSGAFQALQDERFSDVPAYSEEIRLLPARVIPAGTISEFNRATMAAQKAADRAASASE
jgi:hypothetical protein